MGGKKKTKWRKLPLAEFTKECPTTQKIVSKHDCEQALPVEEETRPPIQTYEGGTENSNQYVNEFGEYTEGMMFPTSYVVYNPVEMPVYPNYMMTADTCCYYYMPPEMTPVQEFAPPVPYQEYIPPVKDTVYLLFPAPTLRSSHGIPHIAYDWRNRRRRRRYEGYAEYAVIPNKINHSSNREERGRGEKLESSGNRLDDNQSNQTKTTTSFSETGVLSKENQKRGQEQSVWKSPFLEEQRPELKNMDLLNDNEIRKENQNHNSNKKEFCGVHTTKGSEIKYTHNNLSEMSPLEKADFPKNIECDVLENNLCGMDPTDSQIKSNLEITKEENDILNQSICEKNEKDPSWIQNEAQKIFDNQSKEDVSKPVNLQQIFRNISPTTDIPLDNNAKELQKSLESGSLLNNKECTNNDVAITEDSSSLEEDNEQSIEQKRGNKETGNQLKSSSPSVPDIATTVRNTVPYDASKITVDDVSYPNNNNHSYGKMNQENESITKSEIVMSPTSHLPYSFKSNATSQDTGLESSKLNQLQSIRTNQALYKFAFDENITDQSSSSPSPMDPELHVPSSLISNEIIVHEADTDSDAGSEDVELIPHRYESESFLNGNKHVYVNRLSLAVELLRTRESLPYDAQFKRVVVDSIEASQEETGEVNFGFMEDSYSLQSFEEESDNIPPNFPHNAIVTDQAGLVHLPKDESAMKSISLRDSSLEVAKEVVPPETGLHKICTMCCVS